MHIGKWNEPVRKATYSMILIIWQSGKGKTTETVKRSVIFRVLHEAVEELGGDSVGEAQGVFKDVERILYDNIIVVMWHYVFVKTSEQKGQKCKKIN